MEEDSATIVPIPTQEPIEGKVVIPQNHELSAMICMGVFIGTLGSHSIAYGDNISFKLVG